MTVICTGIRGSDGTPLVLVRCDLCGEVEWVPRLAWVPFFPMWVRCPCGHWTLHHRQPTLAEATAPASEVA